MSSNPEQQSGRTPSAPDGYKLLEELCVFNGTTERFWALCAESLSRLCDASFGMVVVRGSADGGGWRAASVWPEPDHRQPLPRAFAASMKRLADQCQATGYAFEKVPGDRQAQGRFILGTRLHAAFAPERCAALFLVNCTGEAAARGLLGAVRAAAILPSVYQLNTAVLTSRRDLEHVASVLDLMVLLNGESRYLAAAMVLCNEVATRHQCERVSLGWLKRGYVRLQAMSHTERFERKMEAVKTLELAMEECLDQDEEIACPQSEDSTTINRDHRTFSHEQGIPNLCSVPLRLGGDACAVLTCERSSGPFSEGDLAHLRLCADQAVRRLDDLRRTDRWFGARWAAGLRRACGKLVGIEHTWAKIGVLAVTALVLALILVRVPYRVEGSFTVRSDNVSHLPAPFQGYIRSVEVRVGDAVAPDTLLVSLDTRDLELEQSAAQAERNRHLREAEKARAENALADMRIAEAQVEQTQTRLALIAYRLSQAAIRAPFAGIIVRGDSPDELDQRIGAPVQRGEVLLRATRLEDMFVEVEIDERDIDEITASQTGEVAFASQPHLKYPVTLKRIEPVAQPRERDNVFLARCEFSDVPQAWFRPGMSGVCKVDVEKRTLLWIFTHRTVDFLRMLFWW